MAKKSTSKSADRALSILELIARRSPPAGAGERRAGSGSSSSLNHSEISRELNIPKSTLTALLNTLEQRRYLSRSEQGLYTLGPRLGELANNTPRGSDLQRASQEMLRQLAERTGLTAHLAILDGAEAVYIDKAQVDSLLKVDTWVGRRLPLHCTAVGKALLAYLPESEVREIVGPEPLQGLTPKSLTTISDLLEELATVRQQGWAIDDQESDDAVRCVAAPILPFAEGDPSPPPPAQAALGLTGRLDQMPLHQAPETAQAALKAARLIARQLDQLHQSQ
ncbi:MAG: IclR family transcriptional regulator [Acidobacteriota bacterium]